MKYPRSVTRIVCDVDGTICFDGRTIRTEIVDALVDARRDHEVVLASARPVRDLLPVLPAPLQDLDLVGANGAIWRAGGELGSVHHAPQTRGALSELLRRTGVPALVDGSWDYSYTGDGSHALMERIDVGRLARAVVADDLDVWTKVLLFSTDAGLLDDLAALDVVVNLHSGEGHVDVSPGGVDKASGLTRLWGGPREFQAFGNDANDASMFAAASRSWCVGQHPVGDLASHRITADEVAETIRAVATAQ